MKLPKRAQKRPKTHPGSQSGMVMVASMLCMAMLTVLALAGISASTLEVKISAHDREAKQAFYLCEAGLETARYEIIKGWGKGDGGGTFPNFTFTFDSTTMPDVVKTSGDLEWALDKWVNFQLVDSRGVPYRIDANNATYGITQCTGPTDQPNPTGTGRATLRYDIDNVEVLSANGNVGPGANDLTATVAGVFGAPDDRWEGFSLRDSGGNILRITANTADTVTLSGSPTSGMFTILRVWRAPNDFYVYSDPVDPATWPGPPNASWPISYDFNGGYWHLSDQAENLYPITNTTYGTNLGGTEYMRLQLAGGTPGDGPFRVVTNPWLMDIATEPAGSRFVDLPTFVGPGGKNYGTVRVTVEPGATGQFDLEAVSTSTTTGNTKEIAMDVELAADGGILVNDWRQER